MYKYETKSLDEFAVLLGLGARVVKVNRETGDRFFSFSLESDALDLEAKALEHASKTLVMNTTDLLDAYKRAKSIVHSKTIDHPKKS
jgi:hypothetical protein